MPEQLTLIPNAESTAVPDKAVHPTLPFAPVAGWSLDAATRKRGRRGVAEARRILRAARAGLATDPAAGQEAGERSDLAA